MRKTAAALVIGILMMQIILFGIELNNEQTVLAGPTRGTTIYVGQNQTYKSIQDAIDNASSGDDIFIFPGEYSGNIKVNKSLHIEGSDKGSVYLEKCVMNITSSGCEISDLVFNGSDVKFESGRIYITDILGMWVKDCTFNGYSSGIRMTSSDNIRIMDNKFLKIGSYTNNRIEMDNCEDSWIRDNIIYSETNHMIIEDSTGNEIKNNRLEMIDGDLETAYVINIVDSHMNVFFGNNILNVNGSDSTRTCFHITDYSSNNSIGTSSIQGIRYWGAAINGISNDNIFWNITMDNGSVSIDNSWRNSVVNCTITHNRSEQETFVGISLNQATRTRIINCTVNDVERGISIWRKSNRNLVKDCRLFNNVYGIHIHDKSKDNIVERCEIFKNNATGIHITNAWSVEDSRTKIINNFISRCGFGISLKKVREINITECLLDNNTDFGVSGFLVYRNLITYSRLSNNYGGVHLWNSSMGEIRHNEFINNTKEAIDLDDGSDKSLRYHIYLNVFENNNGTNSTYNSSRPQLNMPSSYTSPDYNLLNRTKRGNYWSDLQSPDSDSNGVVDTPYVINSNNQDSFPITERLDNYDHPPIILTENVLHAKVGEQYYVEYEVLDLDTDPDDLIWTLKDTAYWLNISDEGVLSGTPRSFDQELVIVDISVNDGTQMDFTRFQISVKRRNENTHPPLIITQDLKSAYVGDIYLVNYKATDKDSSQEDLKWTFKTNSTWLSFQEHSLSGFPKEGDVGPCWVNISVSDGKFTTFTNFTVIVKSENTAPVITTTNILTCMEDAKYYVDYNATDQDDLYWYIATEANFLSINSSSGILEGTPTNDDVGSWSVRVSVTDGYLLDREDFTVTVKNVNDPPVITGVPKDHAIQNITYSHKMTGKDIDPTNDTLKWSLRSNSDFLGINSSSGLIKGKPDNNDVGKWWVEVILSDGKGGKEILNFTLTVNNTNDPPSRPTISYSSTSLVQGGNQIVTATCFDPDLPYGDKLNFTWSIKGVGVIGYGQSINLSLLKGNYTLILRVTDIYGNYSEISNDISILDPRGADDDDIDVRDIQNIWIWISIILVFLVLFLIFVLIVVLRRPRREIDDEDDLGFDWDHPIPGGPSKPGMREHLDPDMRGGSLMDIEVSGKLGFSDTTLQKEDLMSEILDQIDEDILWEEDMEIVEEVLQEAISFERPSSYTISRSRLEKGLMRKHQKGEISRELLDSLLEIVNRWEEE